MIELLKIVCGGIVFPPFVWKPVISADEGVAIHVKLVPATFESKITLEEVAPVQIACDIVALVTRGRGLIVTTWLAFDPVHPLYDGVTI